MQINKKVLSVAVTALLLLSMVAVIAPAFALSNPTLSVATGSAGTSVTVTGTDAQPFGSVTVYWDSLSGAVLGTGAVDASGAYSVKVKIPSATATAPAATPAVHHYIVVNDGTGAKGTEFVVTPRLVASTTPATNDTSYDAKVLPGDALTLTGDGFKGSVGTSTVSVTVTLDNGVHAPFTITTPPIATNGTGSFVATITVPNTITETDYGDFTVTATDGTNTATSDILVGYYAAVNPTSGPAGVTITVSGRIPPSKAYTVSISGPGVALTQIASGTSSGTGAYSNAYTIPTLLAANDYQIKVDWTTAFATTTLTVSPAPTLTLSPTQGVAGIEITATGANFVASSNVTLYYGSTVVNSTALDKRFKASDSHGVVSNIFSVPALEPGTYTVRLVDDYGASATAQFKILAAAVTTITTASSYVQGDTISFIITSTDGSFTNPVIAIKDGSGIYWWKSPSLTVTDMPDGSRQVLFQDQIINGVPMTLSANAPTGVWNWTITFSDSVGAHTTSATNWRTGTFTVTAGGISGINTQLNNMNAILLQINGTVATLQTSSGGNVTVDLSSLNAKLDSISGNIASLSTSMGTVTTTVNSLSGTISTINSGVATIKTDLGTVQTSLSSLDAVLGAVAGDTATLKTSIGDVSTSLSSIGTTVTSINGNVATIKTDVGTLSGTVTSISGNVATIQTSIGSMQADISNMQSDVSSSKSSTDSLTPLIIVAIVLALVAAIAAIASIVLMRRKIAG
jgi:peptidoglycan hydrolase CwlO-like protein